MRFLLPLFALVSFASADFISKYEYGKMLYENPRGVSCKKCHKELTFKNVIASSGDKTAVAIAPAIKGISKERLARALKKGNGFMPAYKLTEAEIDALYVFLNLK